MLNTHRQWVFAASWVIVAIAIWLVAVPSWVSVTTFWWLNAAAVAIGAVLVKFVRSAGPTRSIAHVLYDTEHQAGAGSMIGAAGHAGQWPSSRQTTGRRP